ncbi:MAG: homoserine O-succinyltransferase, partial [archaeon]
MLILNENHPQREKLGRVTEVITPSEADHADIRALRLGILNLMPMMDETENDILQSIGHSVLQIEPIWIKIASREKSGKHTSIEHIKNFYVTMEEATKDKNLDGLIITGAPIELLDFEEVEYWEELKKIFDYTKDHIYLSMFLCWAAMAAAYHQYGIRKIKYPTKLAGVFKMKNIHGDNHYLTKGINPHLHLCNSRSTDIDQLKLKELIQQGKIIKLLESDEKPEALARQEVGITTFACPEFNAVYNLGHFEYHENTLHQEIERDKAKEIKYPIHNYYKDSETQEIPKISWKSERTIFYGNFLNLIYSLMNQKKIPHKQF